MRRGPRAGALCAMLLMLGAAHTASAQVVRDGSLGAGPAGAVGSLPGESCDYCIQQSDGALSASGRNLFHSFSQFDVGAGTEATFFGSAGVQNVVARVTGGVGSTIDGSVTTSGMTSANLFLIDPAGIVVGRNASLSVPGATYLSSADRLLLDGGDDFEVGDPLTPTGDGAPVAFGFDAGPAAAVSFVGSPGVIDTQNGMPLVVVAGDVYVQGGVQIVSRGGGVEFAAVGEAAVAMPLDIAQFDPQAFGDPLGVIEVTGGGLNASRGSLPLPSNGRVVLRGGRLVVQGALNAAGSDGTTPAHDYAAQDSIRVSSSFIIDEGSDTRAPVGTRLVADRVEIDDGTYFFSQTDTLLTGDIEVRANDLWIGGGSQLVTDTLGSQASAGIHLAELDPGGRITLGAGAVVASQTQAAGDSGDVLVETTEFELSSDDANVVGGTLRTQGSAASTGALGRVRVDVDGLRLTDGGQIASTSEGDQGVGDIDITADRFLAEGVAFSDTPQTSDDVPSGVRASADSTTPPVGGPPASVGAIHVDVGDFALLNGAAVSSRSRGVLPAGDIDIEATRRISLRGGPDGTATLSATGHDGGGGTIRLGAPLIELADGGVIAATTTGGGPGGSVVVHDTQTLRVAGAIGSANALERSAIFAETRLPIGGGASGTIDIDVSDSVLVEDRGEISIRSVGSGDGRTIAIRAGEDIHLTGGARIQASATGTGNGGAIDLEAARRITLRDSEISTQAENARGGDIRLAASERVALYRSRVGADVGTGIRAGGNVDVDPRFVILNASEITATADQGSGGNITITADHYFESADSRLNASSNANLDGQIQIRAPGAEFAIELTPLTEQFVDTGALLASPCAARSGGAPGSLSIPNDRPLPADPRTYQPLPIPSPARDPNTDHTASPPPASHEITHWAATSRGCTEAP